MDKFFKITERGSNYRKEIVGGLTTFFAMAYIIFVNPAQVAAEGSNGWLAGLGADPVALGKIWNSVFIASVLIAFIGTMLYAFYAKLPYAQACGMGLNSFFCTCFISGAYFAGVDLIGGYHSGMVIVFLSGIVFLLLSVTGAREYIAKAMPECLKKSIPAGIGLFIAFIGFKNAGLITANQYTFVQFVDINGAFSQEGVSALEAWSVNSILASLNGFFSYNEWHELKVKNLKIQRRIFCQSEKELTKVEYEKLLKAAKDKRNERIYLVMQTICSTGIRVSELPYITAEAVKSGQAQVKLKGKIRMIFLNKALCQVLKKYMQEQGIKSGCIFITRNGKPLDRHTIWKCMKDLCEIAGVPKEKVFPHNLRHLFAKTYYSLQKDIVRLADILGHSSINTTRIYMISSGREHRRRMEQLRLIL